MSMPPGEPRSLWRLTASAGLGNRVLTDAAGSTRLADLAGNDATVERLRGRSVLLASTHQRPAALALLALAGVARRVLLCPPDLAPDHLRAVAAAAEIEMVIGDAAGGALDLPVIASVRPPPPPDGVAPTEWVLLTSGTTGRPKLVVHTLASLIGPLVEGPIAAAHPVWATFYDIRRYGGLQVLLRALLGGGSLVLSAAGEAPGAFLALAAAAGVTHILGTPTHWRRALMDPAVSALQPRYVRLSGEVADQAILDQLARAFPGASVVHAYASTEAGVGFEVDDGREGFPAVFLDAPRNGVEMRVVEGTLRLRSPRVALRTLGGAGPDADGFVDTGDVVTRRGDRFYFAGRREGVINVGGQKVYPEEVEAVISRHPSVQMAQVRARRSPVTGMIVVADLMLRPDSAVPFAAVRDEVLQTCRAALPAHKVPAILREVAVLPIGPSGKLLRA